MEMAANTYVALGMCTHSPKGFTRTTNMYATHAKINHLILTLIL